MLSRSDTLYGLVKLMDHASKDVGADRLPTLYLYGAKDDIIPRNAAFAAVKNLKPADRSAYYAAGHHLLTRDHQGPVVMADVMAFIRDPEAALPSAAPPIPGAPAHVAARPASRRAAGL